MTNLSLVIPCYNEADNLPYLLERISGHPSMAKVEVILVDNGSSDATPTVLRQLLILYPQIRSIRVEKNQGYGYGILRGLDVAKGNILGWTHADMQTDLLDVCRALEKFIPGQNLDMIVKGKRIGRSPVDYIFTLGMQIFSSLILGVNLDDINAQPKLFTRNFYEKYIRNQAPFDFSIDLFLLYSARIFGVKIINVPVIFSNRLHGDAKGGGGTFKTRIKIISRTIIYIFQIRGSKCQKSNVNY